MTTPASISLVITTYNRVDALRIVLESITFQTVAPQQIIIADDGSTTDTQTMIQEFTQNCTIPLTHVWHEDLGFRAAAIRNRAIEAAQGDYIIFIDGDCILQPTFIERHTRLAEKGYFVAGARVLLSKEFTNTILSGFYLPTLYHKFFLLTKRLQGKVNRLLPLLYLPPHLKWRKNSPLRWKGAKTCNLAAWKADLLAIDGFDEAFEGWGFEDSDLVIRLQHHQIYHKNGRFGTAVFHLWHHENDRSKIEANQKRLQDLQESRRTKALQGIPSSH